MQDLHVFISGKTPLAHFIPSKKSSSLICKFFLKLNFNCTKNIEVWIKVGFKKFQGWKLLEIKGLVFFNMMITSSSGSNVCCQSTFRMYFMYLYHNWIWMLFEGSHGSILYRISDSIWDSNWSWGKDVTKLEMIFWYVATSCWAGQNLGRPQPKERNEVKQKIAKIQA